MPLRYSCSQTGVIGGCRSWQDREKQGFGTAIGEGGRAFLRKRRPAAGLAVRSSTQSSSSPSSWLGEGFWDAGGGLPDEAGRRSGESNPADTVSRAQTITSRRRRRAADG